MSINSQEQPGFESWKRNIVSQMSPIMNEPSAITSASVQASAVGSVEVVDVDSTDRGRVFAVKATRFKDDDTTAGDSLDVEFDTNPRDARLVSHGVNSIRSQYRM